MVVALLVLAVVAHAAAVRGAASSPVRRAALRRQPVTAEVTLVGDPQPGRFGTVAEATLAGAHVLLVAGRPTSSHLLVLDAGDRLGIEGRLGPLEPHDRRWEVRHVVARLAVRDVTSLRPPSSPLTRVANEARGRLLGGHRSLPAVERAVVSAVLVGDTRGLTDDVEDAFRAAGLSHLLVVSGSNVAFVLALVGPLLRRLRLGGRLAAGLGTVLLFAAVTRWEPSVLRASAMAAIVMVGDTAGRPVAGLRALGAAVAGLVVLDPFLVRSVGFGLSVSASAGILLLAPWLRERIGRVAEAVRIGPLALPAGVTEVVAATVAAQIGVAPLALVTFGAPPLVSVPANVVAAPLTAALTIAGTIGGFVPLASPAAGLLARALVTVAEVASSL